MNLIYYRWAEKSMRYVVEEITESPTGRLKYHVVASGIDTEAEASRRAIELRERRDALYPTQIPSLSHTDSQ